MDDYRRALGILALCGLSACGMSSTATGAITFDDYGYRNSRLGYRVLAQPGVGQSFTRGLMNNAWLFDNLYEKRKSYGKGTDILPKETSEYTTTYAFDTDGDGHEDRHEETFIYDLRFKHRQRNAVIFLRTLPISDDLRDKDLRVLVQSYIDGVSGAGYEAAEVRGHALVQEQRFAAELRERGEATLAGQPAYQATFDVANVDQLKVSPNARRTRVRVVFARAPFLYTLVKRPGERQAPSYPVLIVAGYGSMPEDFDKDLPAFTSLLKRVQLGTALGYAAKAQEQLAGPVQPGSAATAGATPNVAAAAAPAGPPRGNGSPVPPGGATPIP